MKKVIRKGVFESASSSMHSICITKNDTHITPEELAYHRDSNQDNDETIYLWKGKSWGLHNLDGFGRGPFKFLYTFEDKFRYCLCEYCGYYQFPREDFTEKYNMLFDIAKEVLPTLEELDINTNDIDIYLDKDGNELKYSQVEYSHYDKETNTSYYVYKDENGEEHVAIVDEEHYNEMPAIGPNDHQSMNLVQIFLKAKGIDLKEFLTNKKYVVVINNDEEQLFQRYIRSGLIDMNFIIEIFT